MAGPNEYFPDGFCHGNELPDDLDLDRMIYPERQPKPEPMDMPLDMTWEEIQQERERREAAREAANYQRDRQFVVTEENVTGAHTGPPRTP